MQSSIHERYYWNPKSGNVDTSVRTDSQSDEQVLIVNSSILNNSRFIGDRMNLTDEDILCCPPPLFHCFGLVLGLLAILTHGGKIVYTSETFDADA